MEVIWDPGKITKEIVWIWNWVCGRWKDLDPLEEIGGEEEDLVSCQEFAHAVALPDAERNQPFILFIPGVKKRFQRIDIQDQSDECNLPSEVMNLSGLNCWGRSKCLGSFIMKDRFARKMEFSGKRNPSTSVGLVVRCNKEKGPM